MTGGHTGVAQAFRLTVEAMMAICSEEEAIVRRLFVPSAVAKESVPATGGSAGTAAVPPAATPAAGAQIPPSSSTGTGLSAAAAGGADSDGPAATTGKRARRLAINVEKESVMIGSASGTALTESTETAEDLPAAMV